MKKNVEFVGRKSLIKRLFSKPDKMESMYLAIMSSFKPVRSSLRVSMKTLKNIEEFQSKMEKHFIPENYQFLINNENLLSGMKSSVERIEGKYGVTTLVPKDGSKHLVLFFKGKPFFFNLQDDERFLENAEMSLSHLDGCHRILMDYLFGIEEDQEIFETFIPKELKRCREEDLFNIEGFDEKVEYCKDNLFDAIICRLPNIKMYQRRYRKIKDVKKHQTTLKQNINLKNYQPFDESKMHKFDKRRLSEIEEELGCKALYNPSKPTHYILVKDNFVTVVSKGRDDYDEVPHMWLLSHYTSTSDILKYLSNKSSTLKILLKRSTGYELNYFKTEKLFDKDIIDGKA